MADADISRTVEIFKRFDKNKDGVVTKNELSAVLKGLDPKLWTDKKVQVLLTAADKDKSGSLQYEEFVNWLYGSKGWMNEKKNMLQHQKTFSSSDFVGFNKGQIDKYYKQIKKLGEGAFGKVSLASHLETEALRAVKSISMQKSDKKALENEINILKELDSPNIVKLYEFFKDARYVYLVMECCSGGALIDRVVDEKTFTEKQAAAVMEQVTGAIYYMHQNHICHRDLKLDNFLLKDDSPIVSCTVQIGDFGLSTFFTPGKPMTDMCGTPYYLAPEIISGSYNEKCDIWALGVMMYMLLAGNPPFNANSMKQLMQVIQRKTYTMPKNISMHAKQLIKEILVAEKQRPTAEAVMKHVWIKEKAPEGTDVPLEESMFANIKNFTRTNKLKKMTLHVIAQRLKDEEIQALKETFVSLDVNHDGIVTLKELRNGLKDLGQNGKDGEEELRKVLEGLDTDADAHIDYTEFLASALDKKQFGQENTCWAAFRVFDKNGNGTIGRTELKQVLAQGDVKSIMGNASVEKVMKEVDTNSDGEISFDEFMTMMRNQ